VSAPRIAQAVKCDDVVPRTGTPRRACGVVSCECSSWFLGIDAIGNTVAATVDATRKLIRTAGAILTVTRLHVPAWMGAVLTICLLIPGPVDELLVLLAIAGMAAFKPTKRADFAQTVLQARAAASVEQISLTAKPPRRRPVTA
jgi:hypothetical protein